MAKKNRARKRGEAMVGSGERLNIARAMIGQRSAKRPNNKGERVLNWEPRCLLCKGKLLPIGLCPHLWGEFFTATSCKS